jgi:tRNA nucleotidyltransferase/poly(A) polymerase
MAKSTLTGEIVDYTGGLEDIKTKTLRVLHDNSFIDDPTRIVRGLKFAVRFGFKLDEHTKKLQNEYLNNINYDMSLKRLQKELKETFDLNSQIAFEKFVEQRIYKLITPKDFQLPTTNFEELINRYQPKNIWIIYAGLIPDIENLPLTKIEKQIIENYNDLQTKTYNSDIEIYKNFANTRLEAVIMYASKNYTAVKKYLDDLKKIKLEITGEDIQALGINPSAKFQKCFDYIIEEKIKNPKITKNEEISLAKQYFKI